ncbi:MAG: (Fe-S)-binding protein [Chloroflexi bacterium]|nr:(Fe-S)-binding protein [Chloroflexota bacterium]
MAETAVLATEQRAPLLVAPRRGEPLDRALFRQCVHCGLCLSACPTYRVFGNELDSPRGRIFQMRWVAEGKIAPDNPHFRQHISLCLDCRACETACPSGVSYGRLVEAARGWIAPASWRERLLRRLLLGGLLTAPRALRLAAAALRVYQRSGLQRVVRATGLLDRLPGGLAALERMQPRLDGPLFSPRLPELIPAAGQRRARVGLIVGCVAGELFAGTNWATARVLARSGCEVVVPPAQRCCGALAVHAGERDLARQLARRNIAAFEAAEVDYVVVNAAGCGSTLKEYGELLERDPRWAERAHAFATKMRDASELLVELGFAPPERELRLRVTYQDACHLAHGQRIREQPRALLRAIPGLELVEMGDSDHCCGSAGVYNLVHYDVAAAILETKMRRIAETGATMVAAANPGCILQLRHGAERFGVPVEVVHPIDLLDRAYGAQRMT